MLQYGARRVSAQFTRALEVSHVTTRPSRNLINEAVIAELMAAGLQSCRYAVEPKLCRLNDWTVY